MHRSQHSILFNACVAIILFQVSGCAVPETATVSYGADMEPIRPAFTLSEGHVSLFSTGGHHLQITSIDFARDSRHAITASDDSLILKWELAKSRVVTRFIGHVGPVYIAKFSPDETQVYSGGSDGWIRVWDSVSGVEVRKYQIIPPMLAGAELDIHSIDFSPDSKTIVVGTSKGAWLVDLATGRQRDLRPKGFGRTWTDIHSVQFSSDGSLILGAYWAEVFLWDSSTLEIVATLSTKSYFKQTFSDAENFSSAVLDSGGAFVATGSSDGIVRFWSVESQSMLWESTFSGGEITAIQFNNKNDSILVASEKGFVRLLNAENGEILREVDLKYSPIRDATYTNGENAIGIAQHSMASILRTSDLSEINYLFSRARIGVGRSLAASPDGKKLAYSIVGPKVAILDLTLGVESQEFGDFFDGFITSLAFAEDSTILTAGSFDGEFAAINIDTGESALTNVSTGQKVRSTKMSSELIEDIEFSPNGRFIAISADDSIVIQDRSKQIPDQSLKTGFFLSSRNFVEGSEFSDDGSLLVGHFGDEGGIGIWRTETWDKLAQIDGGIISRSSGATSTVSISSDNAKLLSSDLDGVVRLWQIDDSRLIAELPLKDNVLLTTFSNDNSRGIAVTSRGIFDWDLRSNSPSKTHYFRGTKAYAAEVLPGKQVIATSHDNNEILFWDTRDMTLLVTYAPRYDDEWIAFTPTGLFDAPIGGLDNLIWRIQSPNESPNLIAVESFLNEFYFDGLLPRILSGARPIPPTDMSDIDRRFPIIELSAENRDAFANLDSSYASLQINVWGAPPDSKRNSPGGVQDIRLLRNGRLVRSWLGDVLGGEESRQFSAIVPLVPGQNTFTVYGYNDDNVKSPDIGLLISNENAKQTSPRLHVLSVGINDYGFPSENLTMSVPDATDFAKIVSDNLVGGITYDRGNVKVLIDSRATKEVFLSTLKSWTRNIGNAVNPELTVNQGDIRPGDTLIVFLSGHGIQSGDDFYFLTSDMGLAPSTIERLPIGDSAFTRAISGDDLESAFRNIEAGQIILIIDACYSGQALTSEEARRGQINAQDLIQLAYEKGISIITSSQSFQTATAVTSLNHGLLTHALIVEGLDKGLADRDPADRRVTWNELSSYAVERVPQLTRELNERRAEIGKMRQKFLSDYTGDLSRSESNFQSNQVPRAYIPRYFRQRPDVLFQLEN